MKSVVGLIAAIAAGAAFAAAYGYAVRAGAGWLDAQALFLIALPYNWTMLRLTGVSNFSLEAPGELVGAAAFDMALAYIAGALAQAIWRGLRRLTARA
ncbi:MAG: hypothetical protein KGM15_06735 [Pseudomonadota bacterium]|nr:hypothetical protein [Pseudomonadota bacterium]